MKKTFIKISAIFLSSALLFAACAKKKDSTNPDDTAQQTTTASDQSNASTESDQGLNDAQVVIAGSSNNARVDMVNAIPTSPIAGATVDSLNPYLGKFTITYNGANANNTRTRTGSITVQRSNGKWSVPGSVLTLTFNNYKVTRVATGKSITLNGTHVVTNTSSGPYTFAALYANNSAADTIRHKVRGSMTLTFDDGTSRVWEVARRRATTYINSVLEVAISGDTMVSGYSKVESWGLNRKGENFYGEISSPIVFSSSCLFEPVSGVYVHQGIAKTLTVTFGVNSDGSVNTTPNCPYGLKLDWTNLSNVAKELVLAY
ncbi:MAG TPA: hypothetical protein VNW06_07715 [Cytophagaceae bacterium]|jgi:hypothetical protein|nr:hypothetical protein [Cytophagaceae bacterium]